MIDPKIQIGLLIITVIAFTIGVATAPGDDYSSVIHTVCIGFVLSAIFYFIVVYLPEMHRRKTITSAFASQYNQFRLNCIGIFLILSKSQEYKNRENLLNQDEFRRYFENNNDEGKNRWNEVANAIQANEFYLQELIYELRMFNEEIKYIRNTVYIRDSEAFNFLNRFAQSIHRVELTQSEYDDIKSFCGFLWSLFTGWNFVDGYKNKEYITKMIFHVTKT